MINTNIDTIQNHVFVNIGLLWDWFNNIYIYIIIISGIILLFCISWINRIEDSIYPDY